MSGEECRFVFIYSAFRPIKRWENAARFLLRYLSYCWPQADDVFSVSFTGGHLYAIY